jgi:hypothetical protein
MKILQKQKELLEKENNSKRSTNEKAIWRTKSKFI